MTEVIDGDTVDMERLGRVRLIGVDTPEDKECHESEATRFTRERLEGKVVQYEPGEQRKDRYDRTLAYLTRDGQMHNEALLSEGYAKVLTIPPNDKYAKRFEDAQREARTTNTGIWDTCERDRIRARQAAVERRQRRARVRRIAARERRRARRVRAERRQAGRERAAARRREQRALEEPTPAPPDDSSGGSGGGSGDSGGGSGDSGGSPGCLPSSACPGKRDGDGDGCYCE